MSIADILERISKLRESGEYRHFRSDKAFSNSVREEGYALTEAINAAKDYSEILTLLHAADNALDAAQDAYDAFVSARDAAHEMAVAISNNPEFSVDIDERGLAYDADNLARAAREIERKAQKICDAVSEAQMATYGNDEGDEDEGDEDEDEGRDEDADEWYRR